MHRWSVEECKCLVEVATFSIQVEETVEEEREKNVVLDDELGVDLGGMSDTFCLSCFIKEIVEIIWRKMGCWWCLWF